MRGQPVIPLCYDGIDPSKLPFPMRFLQGRKLLGSKELLSLLNTLMKGLKIAVSEKTLVPEVAELRKLCKSRRGASRRSRKQTKDPILRIHSAEFWAPTDKTKFVTDTVKKFVSNNKLQMQPCGQGFEDIEPNVHKFLTVKYSFGSHRNQVTQRDDELLSIPSAADMQAVRGVT